MAKNKAKEKLQDFTIAKLRGEGKSTREIGQEIHLSHSEVAKRLKRDDVKARVEETIKYYISYADELRKGFIELCLSEDPKVRQAALSDYHKMIGILPSHAQSYYIGAIYQDNRQQILSSDVLELVEDWAYKRKPIEIEGKVVTESEISEGDIEHKGSKK
jgi:DNA-binding CsgD family transcriptional regulator